MKFEHVAFNVPDARATAAWYVENLGMQIVRAMDRAPFAHFMADETGRTALELYTNTSAPIPDYEAMNQFTLHVAFAVEDAAIVRDRLIAAGATLIDESGSVESSILVFLRDPWGVTLQLCQRSRPLP
jgi:catechol 2,3-dioxygenase-like lactoylglutathione lyase family enzyme